ncbi:MAG: DUF4271 domain-containing protein [Bacteroidota bacterium]
MNLVNCCTKPVFDSIPLSYYGTPASVVPNSFSRKGIHDANTLGFIKAQEKIQFTQSVFSPHNLPAQAYQPSNIMANDNGSAAIALFVAAFFCFALKIASRRLHELWSSFIGVRFLIQLSREGSIFSRYGVIPLYLLFLASSGLLVFQFIQFQNIQIPYLHGVLLYLSCLVFFFLLYFFKSILFKVFGNLIQMKKEFSEYLFQIFLFNLFFGMLITPFVFVNRFLIFDLQFPIFIFCFSTFALLYLYRIMRGVNIFGNNSKFSKFQLFLYLCTLEILPLFLFIKIVKEVL